MTIAVFLLLVFLIGLGMLPIADYFLQKSLTKKRGLLEPGIHPEPDEISAPFFMEAMHKLSPAWFVRFIEGGHGAFTQYRDWVQDQVEKYIRSDNNEARIAYQTLTDAWAEALLKVNPEYKDLEPPYTALVQQLVASRDLIAEKDIRIKRQLRRLGGKARSIPQRTQLEQVYAGIAELEAQYEHLNGILSKIEQVPVEVQDSIVEVIETVVQCLSHHAVAINGIEEGKIKSYAASLETLEKKLEQGLSEVSSLKESPLRLDAMRRVSEIDIWLNEKKIEVTQAVEHIQRTETAFESLRKVSGGVFKWCTENGAHQAARMFGRIEVTSLNVNKEDVLNLWANYVRDYSTLTESDLEQARERVDYIWNKIDQLDTTRWRLFGTEKRIEKGIEDIREKNRIAKWIQEIGAQPPFAFDFGQTLGQEEEYIMHLLEWQKTTLFDSVEAYEEHAERMESSIAAFKRVLAQMENKHRQALEMIQFYANMNREEVEEEISEVKSLYRHVCSHMQQADLHIEDVDLIARRIRKLLNENLFTAAANLKSISEDQIIAFYTRYDPFKRHWEETIEALAKIHRFARKKLLAEMESIDKKLTGFYDGISSGNDEDVEFPYSLLDVPLFPDGVREMFDEPVDSRGAEHNTIQLIEWHQEMIRMLSAVDDMMISMSDYAAKMEALQGLIDCSKEWIHKMDANYMALSQEDKRELTHHASREKEFRHIHLTEGSFQDVMAKLSEMEVAFSQDLQRFKKIAEALPTQEIHLNPLPEESENGLHHAVTDPYGTEYVNEELVRELNELIWATRESLSEYPHLENHLVSLTELKSLAEKRDANAMVHHVTNRGAGFQQFLKQIAAGTSERGLARWIRAV